MAEIHRFEKKIHPLGWTDRELGYMASRMEKRPDGKIRNMMTLFRLMGYDAKVVSPSFKDRVYALLDGKGAEG